MCVPSPLTPPPSSESASGLRCAAVAIIHIPGSDDRQQDQILLTRRPQRSEDPWAGTWCLPGGRQAPEDRNLRQTVLREVREECGLDLSEARVSQTLEPRLAGREGSEVEVVARVFLLPRKPNLTPNPDEVAALHWLALGDFRNPSNHRLGRVPMHSPTRIVACYSLPGAPLWGFTYRLLCHWQGLPMTDPIVKGAKELCAKRPILA